MANYPNNENVYTLADLAKDFKMSLSQTKALAGLSQQETSEYPISKKREAQFRQNLRQGRTIREVIEKLQMTNEKPLGYIIRYFQLPKDTSIMFILSQAQYESLRNYLSK